jgi:VanZ family protein
MKQLYLQLRRLMPYIFWTLVVIVSMFMLVEHAPKENPIKNLDKIQHALVFLTISVAGCLAFKHQISLIIMGLTAFGAVIEVLQATLTTTRTGDFKDWLADIAGILIGLMIVAVYRQFKPKRLQ